MSTLTLSYITPYTLIDHIAESDTLFDNSVPFRATWLINVYKTCLPYLYIITPVIFNCLLCMYICGI